MHFPRYFQVQLNYIIMITNIGLSLKRIILLIITTFSISFASFGQYGNLDEYRAELGLLGGTSFYIGDANPTKIFNRPGVAFGILARYNINPRYTLKFSVTRAEIAGDTRDYPNKYPMDRYAFFERELWDVGLNIECNFLDYGLPSYKHGTKWFSPYIFVGAGLMGMDDKLNDMTQISFNLPFGAGVKFKILNRFNAGLEWSMHTLFVDNVDAVDENSRLLDNPYGFEGISKIKNNDRYSIAKVFVSIDLFKRKHCKRY